jgi:hypothetical protein
MKAAPSMVHLGGLVHVWFEGKAMRPDDAALSA